MQHLSFIHDWMIHFNIPIITIVGLMTLLSFYFGKLTKLLHLPLIIGYMLIGVLLGPSFFNILDHSLQEKLSFITEIALGFVALSIGLELSFESLKKQGSGIITIIFAESFGAFILVTLCVFLITRNLPMALIFGSIAPASAPAGTVAIINEYKAKGSLTKALYAVVGFDDGLGIIIFGFASAIAKSLLIQQAGHVSEGLLIMLSKPLIEIGLSIIAGSIAALLLGLLIRLLRNSNDVLIIIIGFVFLLSGISKVLNLSVILTNMTAGIILVNTQRHQILNNIHEEMPNIMPFLFILFFTLAGSNLHIGVLPQLGLLGIVYIFSRSFGLIGGSRLGAIIGKVEKKIKNYLGLGILSQAGVAIGLSLIVKHEFAGLGKALGTLNEKVMTSGDKIGFTVITTITATCIIFEIIGPILTKIALTKAGEIENQ